jgi:uncharacterized protein (TIGR01777 family)
MVIGITGATGFVGRAVMRVAHDRGHEVIAFTRTPGRGVNRAIETRCFSIDSAPDLSGCDSVLHLAGEPIAGLWTWKKRRRILESRVQGTRRIAEAIAAMSKKPEVLVNASAVGLYGDGGEAELTESAPPGNGFLAETTAQWEGEAVKAEIERVVLLRTAIVLGRGSGALEAMLPPFRMGLGTVFGNGRQWMPWIHLEDHARLCLFAIEDMSVRGPLNASAPWPVRQRDFAKALAAALHRPLFVRVPAFALRLVLRGLAAELLESKRVVPAAPMEFGFGFRFAEIEPALRDLLG